jgi:cellulose biosynthesis protein BcsQ
MRLLAILSGKGGVGKTTTTVALAAAFTELGRKVLACDFDPVGGLTYAVGGVPFGGVGLLEVLEGHAEPDQAARASSEGFAVLTGSVALERRRDPLDLRRLLRSSADLIILDAPPGFGSLPARIVGCCDSVLVPIIVEPLAVRTIEFVLGMIDAVKPPPKMLGVLPTMYEPRRMLNADQTAALTALGVPVLAPIPRSVAVAEASLDGVSVLHYAPKSPATDAYRELALVLSNRETS